ncbi:MAG: 4-alpha-glucanotransferase [Gemmatimonadaceae bacterium]|nr:4-alpha-glucanotransferase [Gemmatimonadaceae bacterium]
MGAGTSTETSPLHRLASEAGIIPGYHDQTGREWRATSDETRRAILGAMGFDTSSEEATTRELKWLVADRRSRPIAPVRVVKHTDPSHNQVRIALAAPQRGAIRWEVSAVLEDGEELTVEGGAADGAGHEVLVQLPAALPLGYHIVRVALHTATGPFAAEQLLIVVPTSCVRAEELLKDRRAWGIVANLYSIRSARNWGVGDTTDLAALARWAGSLGAQFVGVNPLHAIRNAGTDVSPYSPITRLFRNPIYIDVEAIPELQDAPGVRMLIEGAEFARGLEVLRAAATIDYERVMAVKWPLLRACHDAASVREDSERWKEFRRWCSAHEPELTAFAMHMAREVGGFRSESTPTHADAADADADFHRWVQWELERQLGGASRAAADAGMRIGLYQDLAIGSAGSGSDAEAFGELFVRGMAVGAPPDPYSAHGQNWGFPPIDPTRLRAGRYRYFIELVRAGFRNAGALRIDHVMGLFRLFWIPDGKLGEDGAYVRYPSEDLLGILALESVRNQALVVGEDLGTVPPDVPPTLHEWGILSSKVVYFERERDGAFRGPSEYPAQSLATANTHDMATLLGFLHNRDVELRVEHGLVADGGGEAAHAERERDKQQLRDMLIDEGLLDRKAADDTTAFRAAVHEMLAASPAWLVGVSLDDLAGEVEGVNLPGVAPDRYPAWQRRMSKSLEQLRNDPDVAASLGARLVQGR